MTYTLSKPFKYREWEVTTYGAQNMLPVVYHASSRNLHLSVFSALDNWYIESHSGHEDLFELPSEVINLHAALDHAELLYGWTDKL